MTENETAALIVKKSYEKGIILIVNLVVIDDRVYKYRHLLPKNNELKICNDSYLCKEMGTYC